MVDENNLEPAPDEFRELFKGQALGHLDEIVTSWRMGGHPISWSDASANFEVALETGPVSIFEVLAPSDTHPAGIGYDIAHALKIGIPTDFARRIHEELLGVGKLDEGADGPLRIPLGKFSRGDRKVFLAYTLTVARFLASNLLK